MKLIVDTNILLKALIKDSTVRAILLNPNHLFYIPEYAVEEVMEHMSLLTEKTRLDEEEIKLALNILLTNIQIVPAEEASEKWSEAREIMKTIDKDDASFIAASLAVSCDGIWSDDKDLKRQKRVKVLNTREIISLI